jgi:hypothetical protein
MMRFTAFLEIQLNPGIRDIGDCRRTKPTRYAAITHTHRAYISVRVPRNTHPQHMSLDISPISLVPPELPDPPLSLYR